jgi:glycosyltransferase involved in cell wall biosynthesis
MVFAEAAAALLNEDLNLHFTAAGPDAGDLAEFRRFLASHANVASRMEYAGALSRDAARNLLKATDIYVLPSIGEVYPVTALEAMAAGAALVITSDCPLSQELAASGCAVVTDPNVLDVSAGVRRLIADPALREAISNRAFKEVSSRYAISAVAQRLIRIYDDAEDRSSQEDDG